MDDVIPHAVVVRNRLVSEIGEQTSSKTSSLLGFLPPEEKTKSPDEVWENLSIWLTKFQQLNIFNNLHDLSNLDKTSLT